MTERRSRTYPDYPETPWIEAAMCRRLVEEGELTPDDFYPLPGETAARAKQACAMCPVRLPCLDYSLAIGEKNGVWGGATEADRRRIRRKRRNRVRA